MNTPTALLATALLLPTGIWADLVPSAIPPGKWRCIAYDAKEQNFPAVAPNLKHAMVAATSLCRNKSSLPKSCHVAESFCDQGPLSLIEDYCLVSDDMGHVWNTNGENACQTAMQLCNQFQFLQAQPGQCNVKHR